MTTDSKGTAKTEGGGGAGDSVADRERAFFAQYYGAATVNPRVNRMRLRRHCAAIMRHCTTDRPLRVLSIGCGAGELERMLAPKVGAIVAVDLSPVAIEQAKRLTHASPIDNIEFRCGDAMELAATEPFDLVVCAAFLHHVPEEKLGSLMDKLIALLKPGGGFYSQDPNVHGLLRRVGRRLMGPKYHRYHSPDERELDPRALAHDACERGLHAVRTRGFDVALIPLSYLFPRLPFWMFYPVLGFDWAWCAAGFGRWASGFYLVGRKPMPG